MKIDPVVQKKVMWHLIRWYLWIGGVIIAPLMTIPVLLMGLTETYPWGIALWFLLLIPTITLAMIALTLITYFEGRAFQPWMYEQLGLPDPEADEKQVQEEESEESK